MESLGEPTARAVALGPSQVVLEFSIGALLVGAVVAVVALRLIAPDQMVRAAAPTLVALIALTGWYLLSRGHIELTKSVVASGAWVAVTATAFFTGGVQAPVIIAYPMIILTAAWLISARAALSLAGLTLLATFSLVLLEARDGLPKYLSSSPLMYAGDQSVIYVLSTVLAVFLVRTYQRQVDELHQVGRDLSRRTLDLERSQTELNQAQQVAKMGNWVYQHATRSMRLSSETCRLLDLPEGTTGGLDAYLARVHPQDRADVDLALQAALQGHAFDQEHRIMVGESVHWIRLKVELAFAPDGSVSGAVGVAQDITERKLAEEKINNLVFYDTLTKLPNRRLLVDRLEQVLSAGSRHRRISALLFVDLDDFKILNDTLGHDHGDLLLQQAARRLSACIREGDTVARLGSDEFVVMLEDLSENPIEAATRAETVGGKILASLKQDYQLGDHRQHSTACIGVTLFDGSQPEGSDEPLKRAELAMFQAKAIGPNSLCFFDTQMQQVVSARAALEADLREALLQDQFLLHYQAQVAGKGHLTGVEALVRWQHPGRGLVSPAEFIPLAEDTGLILPLGQWVLESACKQLALWAEQPALAHLTVAVNVSARQFHQPEFVAQVLAVLERTGANPQRLKLELTESLLVNQVEQMIAKMNQLKAKGVGFSLDDFGTGYSSLSYLKRLPLDQLKIDQGFVRDILTDPNDAAIARMVVALGASLGLAVIAEGVETLAQKEFLARLGCHAYQGYFFSRPLRRVEFEAYAQQMHQTLA